jgi:hypothetical protein
MSCVTNGRQSMTDVAQAHVRPGKLHKVFRFCGQSP